VETVKKVFLRIVMLARSNYYNPYYECYIQDSW